MFFAYILFNSEIGRYYIGATSNLEARIKDHNKKHKTKYTRKQSGIWELAYKEEFLTMSAAVQREKEIKKWKSKKMIIKLVEQSRL